MRTHLLVLGVRVVGGLVLGIAAARAPAAAAGPGATTLNFAVTRNGDRIGTSTVRLSRDGDETIAEIASHVQVKIAYITVYRFDQSETEHWADGRLLAMTARTDDNGTIHKVTATRRGDALSIDADGKASEIGPTVIPVSLWNASLLRQTVALDPQHGTLTPVSVVDRGEEQLVLKGRPTTAHHYQIKTSFPQDVWYDAHHRLLKVELKGSDGSRIQYQPG